MSDFLNSFIQIIYFIITFLFILGLKKMSSAATARTGLTWAGIGMLIAVLITYFHDIVQSNYLWMTVAIIVGGAFAFIIAKSAKITETPKMIALFNGFGGGSAAAIAAVALIKLETIPEAIPESAKYLAVAGALLGCISFSGSLIAFSRLHGLLKDAIHFPMQQWLNALILVVTMTFGIAIVLNGAQFEVTSLILFFVLALLLGALLVIPVSNNVVTVLVSLFNALTGLAVGFVGYVIVNPAMMIVGLLVAATGIKLTLSLSKAMNRPLSTLLFGNVSASDKSYVDDRTPKALQSNDAAMMMAFARNVIIVPGYGMAVAQAQFKVWEMCKLLKDNGVGVKFAIHPAAGRMPGHMNVLLSEAGIPYDSIYDINDINGEFDSTDVVLVLGANDTTNPAARFDQKSPIYGMPILNADQAKNVIVIKRATGTGFSGIDNSLYYQDNTGILYGDALAVLSQVVSDLKQI